MEISLQAFLSLQLTGQIVAVSGRESEMTKVPVTLRAGESVVERPH